MENSTTLYNIQTLRERIQRIYQELDQVTAELVDLEQSVLPPAEQEFHAAFPDIPLDSELLALAVCRRDSSLPNPNVVNCA